VLGLRWGGVGAALAWAALNVAVLVVGMRWMHTRLLPGELGRWYAGLAAPALAAVAITALGHATLPDTLVGLGRLSWLAATGVAASAAAVGATAGVRRRVLALGASRAETG